jgi:hypothetical protein
MKNPRICFSKLRERWTLVKKFIFSIETVKVAFFLSGPEVLQAFQVLGVEVSIGG